MRRQPPIPKKVLPGQIALVAGATRGAGRGIAIALGEAGATVYCTGRPETIEETAELVTAAGGHGIAVRVDHTEPREVKKLVAFTTSHEYRVPRLCGGQQCFYYPNSYLSRRSASSVLLEPALLAAKLSSGYSSVVSDCVGGCDG